METSMTQDKDLHGEITIVVNREIERDIEVRGDLILEKDLEDPGAEIEAHPDNHEEHHNHHLRDMRRDREKGTLTKKDVNGFQVAAR